MTRREYKTLHAWMNRNYPRTGRCEWCGRTTRATEYACAGHRYTRNRADWFEFCDSCHKKFDGGNSPETRAKMSAAHKGKRMSAETRAKMSAAKTGQTLSAEARSKIGAANARRVVSPETRAKIAAASRTRTASAETRARMAESARLAWLRRHS